MAESRKTRFLLKLLRLKVVIPLLILLSLVSAPFVYRARQLSGLPDIGDPLDVEAFGTVSLDDADNAVVEYRAAAKLMVPLPSAVNVSDEIDKIQREGWSASSDAVRKWVADNQSALEVWRRGTEKPHALYCQPIDQTLETLFSIRESRDFCRLALLEGFRLEASGDMQSAWEWYRAMFRYTRHLGMHGTLLERSVGITMYNIWILPALTKWSADSRVTPEQLRQALDAVRDDYKITVPTSETVKVEYLFLRNTLERDDLLKLITEFGLYNNDLFDELGSVGLFLRNEPDLSRRLFQHEFANALARFEKSRIVRPAPNKQSLTSHELAPYLKQSFLAKHWMPDWNGIGQADTREQTKQAALVVILAAEIYRREQGQYPETAEDLVGRYLYQLPADPHGKVGEIMRYHRDENGIVVWGIGLDGVDDGGDIEYMGRDESPDIGLRSGNYPKPVVPYVVP